MALRLTTTGLEVPSLYLIGASGSHSSIACLHSHMTTTFFPPSFPPSVVPSLPPFLPLQFGFTHSPATHKLTQSLTHSLTGSLLYSLVYLFSHLPHDVTDKSLKSPLTHRGGRCTGDELFSECVGNVMNNPMLGTPLPSQRVMYNVRCETPALGRGVTWYPVKEDREGRHPGSLGMGMAVEQGRVLA